MSSWHVILGKVITHFAAMRYLSIWLLHAYETICTRLCRLRDLGLELFKSPMGFEVYLICCWNLALLSPIACI